MLGNVIYNGSSITGVDASAGIAGSSANAAFTNRASNALTFQSDKMAGFGVNGMFALNNQNQTQFNGASGATIGYTAVGSTTGISNAGGNTNWNGWGLSADYTWNKLYLTAAYQSFKTQYSNPVVGAGAATTVNLGSGATGGQLIPAAGVIFTAQQLADKQTYVGGTYDFGILKAYAQWVGRKIQQDNGSALATTGATGTQLNRTAQQIGVRSYITPTIEAWASAGMGKIKGAPANTGELATVNFFGYQLGSNYYLSKRTNLYAIYGQQQATSSTGSTAGSGATANQYALGIRHTF
jgi:predicted porin